MKRLKGLYAAFVATIIVGVLGSSVGAVTTGGFGGRPANPDPANPRTQSIFIYTIDRGAAKSDQVIVVNNSSTSQTIELYAVDGVVTNTGSYTCEQQAEAKNDLGGWVKIAKSEVKLEPRQEEKVDFTVTMPGNADVGEHNACIVFQSKQDEGVVQGGVRIRTRQAVRLVATVPGDLKRSIDIASFATKPGTRGQEFSLTVKNTGNVSADVDNKVILTNVFGGIRYENGGSYPVLANQKLDLNFTDSSRPFFGGWYYAQAKISYDKRPGMFGVSDQNQLITKQSERQLVFFAPAVGAWVLLAALIVLVMSGLVWRARRNRHLAGWVEYTIKPGDTIETIATQSSANWREIARVNKIKAPFSVEPGAELRIPPQSTTPKE